MDKDIKALKVGGQHYDVILYNDGSHWKAYAIKVLFPPEGAGWGRDTNIWVSGSSEEEVLTQLRERLTEGN